MSVPPRIAGHHPAVSFEFFPAKNDAGEAKLFETIRELGVFGPEFVSVTYGAGGTTRERTAGTVARILAETSLDAASHLTCVGASREEVDEVVRAMAATGVRRFVALRGDPEGGLDQAYIPAQDGYANAAELCAGLTRLGDFDISVSAYPEQHPQSGDWATDLDHLKRKQDNGAKRALTQFFFDNDLYEAYVERALKAGITIPIVPGILPIHNLRQAASFASKCGATVPWWVTGRFDSVDPVVDAEEHARIAVELATVQCADLVSRGVGELHFYTMNRSDLTGAVCRNLGLGSNGSSAEAA